MGELGGTQPLPQETQAAVTPLPAHGACQSMGVSEEMILGKGTQELKTSCPNGCGAIFLWFKSTSGKPGFWIDISVIR